MKKDYVLKTELITLDEVFEYLIDKNEVYRIPIEIYESHKDLIETYMDVHKKHKGSHIGMSALNNANMLKYTTDQLVKYLTGAYGKEKLADNSPLVNIDMPLKRKWGEHYGRVD